MRNTLFSYFILLAGSLSAQNYTQNALPIQQTKIAVDCYTSNLDNGNSALRRGEVREALRLFNEAKNCPDAQNNSRRTNELESKIEKCELLLGIRKNDSPPELRDDKSLVEPKIQKRSFSNELPTARRNYKANPVFLKDTLDDCFGRMVAEADRAFRLKFWEDAAALYRAAKNCSDAEQKDRQKMSEKIAACRNAAENELFAKQQEAERQARNAIAANLADDAQELLRNTDRSLAFRLADFANQYIAPDDNPDCVQAMFDAWYYQNSEDTKHREDELYHPVFSYELADNLGENTQVKFEQQKDGSQWLWAFVPNEGDMFAWEMPSMKLVQSFGTGEYYTYKGFEISPTGDFLFWGTDFFDLRKGSRSVRVNVPQIGSWCFNQTGDVFFYENVGEETIYALDIKKSFDQSNSRKGSKISNNAQPVAVTLEVVNRVPTGLISMEYVDGKFWLGFRNQIGVIRQTSDGRSWEMDRIIPFEGVNIPEFIKDKDLNLKMFPKEGFAIMGDYQQSWVISLDSQRIEAKSLSTTRPIGISPNTGRLACEYTGFYNYNSFLLLDLKTGDTLLRQQIPLSLDFGAFKGCYSSNAHWVAAATTAGNVSVWALQDAQTVWSVQLPYTYVGAPMFSPDGSKLFVRENDSLAVFSTGNSKTERRLIKNFSQSWIGASNQWAFIQVSPDSAELTHLTNGTRLKFPLLNEGLEYLYAVDTKEENFVAYLSDWNKISVCSIKTGEIIASRVFEGGLIGALFCLPGSDNLLVVQHSSMGESSNAESTVKIWSPKHPTEKPRALRLHEYAVEITALNPSRPEAAFSNGTDIRIFDLNNIENEVLKIRSAASESVRALAFKPGSNLLAAAYTSGKVVFWDVQTGQASLQLQVVPNAELFQSFTSIEKIGFSKNGTLLHISLSNGELLSYAIDPSYIRGVAQNENKHLQSFVSEHIVRYNLESALYYPGNFERLAESGDNPLIRSFFQYFREQAIESNNIIQVRNYCERAFYLYERLDENTKLIWKPEMNAMYEDYTRKLLFRGNLSEASALIAFIRKEFGKEPVLLNAHRALLNRDYATASALYTKFLLTTEDGLPISPDNKWPSDQTKKDLTQLRDYELLDSIQQDCFCGSVSFSKDFSDICPAQKAKALSYLSPPDQIRWEIFQKQSQASQTFQFEPKAALLEDALQKVKGIVAAKVDGARQLQETIIIELAATYRKWGVFESYSPLANEYFNKAIQTLNASGTFTGLSDTSRLALIASTRLAYGKFLFDTDKINESIEQFNAGLEVAQPLSEIVYEADTSLLILYYDNIIGPLYEKLGTAFLLTGNTERARQAYERAVVYNINHPFNSLYLANVSLFEQNNEQAFLDYGSISNAPEAAIAFFEIERLLKKFPEKSAAIEPTVRTLYEALSAKKRRLVGPEMDYWFATFQSEYFLGLSQLDSAVYWRRKAMESAHQCIDQPNPDDEWKRRWLDEHVNLPYLLLLQDGSNPAIQNECIDVVDKAEKYLKDQDSTYFYYPNRLMLKTNFGHALMLRNKPGDRTRAMEEYQIFIDQFYDSRGYDTRDMLKKDIQDFKHFGLNWPSTPELELLLKAPENQ